MTKRASGNQRSGRTAQYKGFKSNLQHRAVARALTSWRDESGLGLKEASDAAKWSTAKTSMMQNAACAISPWDVLTLALIYKVDDHLRVPVINGAQRAHDSQAFDRLHNATQCVDWTYGELAAESSSIRIVATDAFPHVVRTFNYANALRDSYVNTAAPRQPHHYTYEKQRQVDLNLSHESSLHLHLILSDALLRRRVGNVPVMVDQLVKLLKLAQQPNILVQVLPDSAGELTTTTTSFSIMSFREDRFDDVVYIENQHAITWLEEYSLRTPYTQTFTNLTEFALSGEDSNESITQAIQTLQTASS